MAVDDNVTETMCNKTEDEKQDLLLCHRTTSGVWRFLGGLTPDDNQIKVKIALRRTDTPFVGIFMSFARCSDAVERYNATAHQVQLRFYANHFRLFFGKLDESHQQVLAGQIKQEVLKDLVAIQIDQDGQENDLISYPWPY
jgi:hypothetical protein